MNLYVLEIPDLGYVINQDSIDQWEIFLRHTGRENQNIRWQASSSANGFMFRSLASKRAPIESVQIDFIANRIIIRKRFMEDEEFKKFLRNLLTAFFIRVRPDEMHFIVFPNHSSRHNFGIMEE